MLGQFNKSAVLIFSSCNIKINNIEMDIKKTTFLLLSSIFLFSCSDKKQDSGYIKADISKLTNDFDQVVINRWGYKDLGDSIKTSDTVDARDGKFEYHFKVNEPKLASLFLLKNKKKIANLGFRDKSSRKQIFWGELFLGNENVEINVDSLYEIKQSRGIKFYNVDFEGSNEAEMYMKTFREMVVSTKNIKKNPSCYALLHQLFDIKENYSTNQLKYWSSLFSNELKKSVSYNIIQGYIKKREDLEKYGYRKNFNWIDINNNKYSFDQAKNGKQMMLLIFWASWCSPCRQEIPELKKFYNDYKDKVSLVSLSIDNNFDNWKGAVEKEKMPWLNLSGLPARRNGIKKEYNISSVPNLILLDKNGKVLINGLNNLPEVIKIINKKSS
jgi:thiol-disulfide isomerase/thioredoxin